MALIFQSFNASIASEASSTFDVHHWRTSRITICPSSTSNNFHFHCKLLL